LAHDPEKWPPVFGKDHAQKEILLISPFCSAAPIAFSSEVDTGSREENASK